MKFGEPSDVQTARTYRYYTQTAKSIQAETTNRKKLQTGRTPKQQQRTGRTPRQQQLTGRIPRQQQPICGTPRQQQLTTTYRQNTQTATAYKHEIRRTLRRADIESLQALHTDSNKHTGRTYRREKATNRQKAQTATRRRAYSNKPTISQTEHPDSNNQTGRIPRQQQPTNMKLGRRTLRRTDSMNLQVLHPNSNRQTYIQQQAHTEVEPTNKKLEEPQRQEENKDKGQHSTDRMNPLSPVSRRSTPPPSTQAAWTLIS